MLNLAMSILLGLLSEKMDGTKEKVAELSTRALARACDAYLLDPGNGNVYPKMLANLVNPPGGGRSLLKNGAADLLDPWGKAYKYEVAANEKGDTKPYVWAERVVNGKTKVIGQKPPPKKQ